MEKKKVLFVCVHNSARSQMAEEYLRRMAGDKYEVESAGLEQGTINPLVKEVLKEEGIDISGKQTQSVFALYQAGKLFEYVITVCSREAEEKCPVFPRVSHKLNWPFEDPSKIEGSREVKLEKIRKIRDQIKEKVRAFIDSTTDD